MANVALGKPVEEQITNASAATDGVITGYTGHDGFASRRWPGPLTVDLGRDYQIICIRFLLWDGLGNSTERADRIYKYRLLTSIDRGSWRVIHDTFSEGGNGWQVFMFAAPSPVRYVRIYSLWNSANDAFHVVEIEAHDTEPPELNADMVLRRVVEPQAVEIENGDALPLQINMGRIISGIERLVDDNAFLNPVPFRELTAGLRRQVRDMAVLEKSMDAIRREIVGPVQRELTLSSKLGKFSVYGFWVGLLGGLLAIWSLAITLFKR